MIYCGHCQASRPEGEFQKIAPAKVVDEMGRQVVYAKHLPCGYKTLKRVAQPAGKGGKLAAA